VLRDQEEKKSNMMWSSTILVLTLVFQIVESVPVSSRLRFSQVGGECSGGEHQSFRIKSDPRGTEPYEITVDGNTESIPIQPALETRSTGECTIRDQCLLSPTESNNGATGCEKEPANVVCCSETKCEAFDKRTGVCMLDSKCAAKEDEMGGKYESISDIVYAGTAKGAKGCRHLKDDVRCCVPISTPTPPSKCEDKCDIEDLEMCGSALISCTDKCTTDASLCMDCLEKEAAPECCPCIKEKFPAVSAVVCETGPCSRCIGELKSCPVCKKNAAKCFQCLARKNLGKCCSCARKVYPSIPQEWTCKFSEECSACANSVSQCVTAENAACSSSGSAIKCASCITRANADDCCDCLKQAADAASIPTLPVTCPLPGSCSRCGDVMEKCENDCVSSFDVVKCATCLDKNDGFGCCRCMKDLGINIRCGEIKQKIESFLDEVEGAVDQVEGVVDKVKKAIPSIP